MSLTALGRCCRSLFLTHFSGLTGLANALHSMPKQGDREMTEPTPESPVADVHSQEQEAFAKVNEIIEILLTADADTRRRIFDTVGAFFGYDQA